MVPAGDRGLPRRQRGGHELVVARRAGLLRAHPPLPARPDRVRRAAQGRRAGQQPARLQRRRVPAGHPGVAGRRGHAGPPRTGPAERGHLRVPVLPVLRRQHRLPTESGHGGVSAQEARVLILVSTSAAEHRAPDQGMTPPGRRSLISFIARRPS